MTQDVDLMKAFAARPIDWGDVRGIVERQKGKLNNAYILRHLEVLAELKEAPEILTRARQLLEGGR